MENLLEAAGGVCLGLAVIGGAVYLAFRPYLDPRVKPRMPDSTNEFKDNHGGDWLA